MPKVSDAHLAARRSDILAAARRAFARHGYEGATVKVREAETGLSADRAYGGRSLRSQTKSADRAGARYVVLFGRAEMEKGAVAVRDMEAGEQVEVPRARVVAWLHEHLGTTHRDLGK